MFRKAQLLIAIVGITMLVACQTTKEHDMLMTTNATPVLEFESFSHYQALTRDLLVNHRYFLSHQTDDELAANMPFEVKPRKQLDVSKGIILVHGLGDSPFSFVDLANSLANEGFLVRTILLSGHGTKPGDMLDASYKDWQLLLERHVRLLKTEVDDVYLGGFSTGGNLVTSYALHDDDIQGLVLISPGFKSDTALASLAPIAAWFKDWLYKGQPQGYKNSARYMTMPTNGLAQYYHTSDIVMDQLEDAVYKKPTFIAISADDSVLDTTAIKSAYNHSFSNKNNRLLYFSNNKSVKEEGVSVIDSYRPEFRVSNMSHMGLLFSPDNQHYGIDGSQRVCNNGQQQEGARARCESGGEVWYSAWGHQEPNKVHARLTFNPSYNRMIDEIKSVLSILN